jgi:hypothetical protein
MNDGRHLQAPRYLPFVENEPGRCHVRLKDDIVLFEFQVEFLDAPYILTFPTLVDKPEWTSGLLLTNGQDGLQLAVKLVVFEHYPVNKSPNTFFKLTQTAIKSKAKAVDINNQPSLSGHSRRDPLREVEAGILCSNLSLGPKVIGHGQYKGTQINF